MPVSKDKLLIWGAAILAVVFIVAVVVSPHPPNSNKAAVPAASTVETSPPGTIGNAFAPSPSTPFAGKNQTGNVSPASSPIYQPNFSFLKNVGEAVFPSSSLSNVVAAPDVLLTLPEVALTELNVSAGGAGSATAFYRYLALNYQKANFDFKRLNQLLQTNDKSYPTIFKLIDRAVAAGPGASSSDSLGIFKDFISAKMAFEKQVKVAGDGVAAAQTAVALDNLSLTVLDDASRFIQGTMTADSFYGFYGKYRSTVQYYSRALASGAGLSLGKSNDNIFSNILGLFGLRKVVRAQLPLGGLITWQTVCTCEAMGAIMVPPPGGGNFLLPPFFLLFPFFDPTIGHFVLGTYEPSPLPCLQLPFCTPDPTIPEAQGIVIMLGTSE